MSAIQIKNIDESINSDITMLATDSFNNILNQVQDSCLNFQLQVSPFSALISIKKSFVKDKSGCLILPSATVSACKNSSISKSDGSDVKCQIKLQQELDLLQIKYDDLYTELTRAYESIKLLKKTNQEQQNLINERTRELKVSKEATYALNQAYNDARIMHEKDKLDIFKNHKSEVKSWRRELGEMTRKHKKLEKKFEVLSEGNVKSDPEIPEDISCEGKDADQVTDEDLTICTLCGVEITNYVPDYFYGEVINPACSTCIGPVMVDPFSSFPDEGIPPSLACHWIPALSDYCNFTQFNLSSIPSMRAHYARIQDPGCSFSAMEDVLQEFRMIWRAQRQEMINDCKQS